MDTPPKKLLDNQSRLLSIESLLFLFNIQIMSDKLNIKGFETIASMEYSPMSTGQKQPINFRERMPQRSFDIPTPKVSQTTTGSKPRMDYLKPPNISLGPSRPSAEEPIKCDRKKVQRNVEMMVQLSMVYMQLKKYNTKEKQARLKEKAHMQDCQYMDRKNVQELYQHQTEIKKVRQQQAELLDTLKITYRNDELVQKQNQLMNLTQQLQKLRDEHSSLQKISTNQNDSLTQIQSRSNISGLIAQAKEELNQIKSNLHKQKQKTIELRRQLMHFTMISNAPLKKPMSAKKKLAESCLLAEEESEVHQLRNLQSIPETIRDQGDSSHECIENIDEELKRLRELEQTKRKILSRKEKEIQRNSQQTKNLRKLIQSQVKEQPIGKRQLSKSNMHQYRSRKVNNIEKQIR